MGLSVIPGPCDGIETQAAAANWSKETPVSVAETSHSIAATATSFACGVIFASTGGPFNS